MNGKTLEEIAKSENITRERVRQIIKKSVNKVHTQYLAKTGLELFDEDYYHIFIQLMKLIKAYTIHGIRG